MSTGLVCLNQSLHSSPWEFTVVLIVTVHCMLMTIKLSDHSHMLYNKYLEAFFMIALRF